MTPIATPSSTSTRSVPNTATPCQATIRSSTGRNSTFTSPWSAALLVLGLLGLAISGTLFAFRTAPTSPTGGNSTQSAAVTVHADPGELVGLMARGQPERWSSAEAKAVGEERQGNLNFSIKAYKSAMQKAIYNQKNGWTDDGTERAGKGSPLRNNQKRGGANMCVDAYMMTAASCGESGGGITGEEAPKEGPTEFEEL